MAALSQPTVVNSLPMTPGDRLRELREKLRLTLKDVELASSRLAEQYGNPDFAIPASRLSEMEIRGLIPSIYRLHSLAVIYGRDIRELMRIYGIDPNLGAAHAKVAQIPTTHLVSSPGDAAVVNMPTVLDPGFDAARTAQLTRLIEEWGHVPMQLLEQLPTSEYLYGYIGLEDWTMWPLIKPGAFIQVDKKKVQVQPGPWVSEYERPIYFVETRDGFTCCWCALEGPNLVLASHPLSHVPARVLRNRHDAIIKGTVVGIAQKLTPPNGYAAATAESLSARTVR